MIGAFAGVAGGMLATAPALANITGACSGTATDTTGKANPPTIDIATTDKWLVSKDSKIEGKGHSDAAQGAGFANMMVFGYGLFPIAGGTDASKQSHDGSGSLDVSSIADKVRVIGVGGASDSCSGTLTIIIGDEQPMDTTVGKISALIALIGALILLALALF